MRFAFGFSGRSSRLPYAILTLGFATAVSALAVPSGEPLTQLLTAPWTVLGRAADNFIESNGASVPAAAAIMSLVFFAVLLWTFWVMTARRLRDIGQSPWWTVLIMFSGVVVPAMLVLSVLPSAHKSGRAWSGSLRASAVTPD
ncbi:MAG: hypothetical protein DCF28_11855 [Alphaproteobacteria bacterium]|nr:MAG: hypothetical protein DCF28_11855 [Alphaproteobacteria bacterium]PZO40918.1 MAG: hypothetical protein DCE92_01785 [Alphaproteobacteria bacterium]